MRDSRLASCLCSFLSFFWGGGGEEKGLLFSLISLRSCSATHPVRHASYLLNDILEGEHLYQVFINVVYRYIQISGMMLGAMLEADSRLRAYEFHMRREKKRLADEAVWRRWEGLVEEKLERQKSSREEE